MQAGGSNLNSGSDNNNSAKYTSTNGNWNSTTGVFIPTDGTNPYTFGVKQGDFASVYVDGASIAVYIARVEAVSNAVNGQINLSTTGVAYGVAPSTSATARTIKVGGAWLGPNGTSVFPFGLSGGIGVLISSSGDLVRVNAKNDQTYTLTVALDFLLITSTLQGYANTPGDGSKATFSSNVATGGACFSNSSQSATFIDLEFVHTAVSSTSSLFQIGANGTVMIRCVARGARNSGFVITAGAGSRLLECEAYDNNKANTTGFHGGMTSTSTGFGAVFMDCYSHDNNTGANCHGFASSGYGLMLINCISANNGGNGFKFQTASGGGFFDIIGCTFYNNGAEAILDNTSGSSQGFRIIKNNIFASHGRAIFINSSTVNQAGILYNNLRYNIGTRDILRSVWDTETDLFTSSIPFIAAATGDFTIISPIAIGTGRQFFTQTDGIHSGTTSFPDLGATQSQPLIGAMNASTTTLRDGYVNHEYYVLAEYESSFTASISSGSLPPGLTLTQPTPTSFLINGTPTVVGEYSALLAVVTPDGGSGTFTLAITVYDDPDEGIGGMILG